MRTYLDAAESTNVTRTRAADFIISRALWRGNGTITATVRTQVPAVIPSTCADREFRGILPAKTIPRYFQVVVEQRAPGQSAGFDQEAWKPPRGFPGRYDGVTSERPEGRGTLRRSPGRQQAR